MSVTISIITICFNNEKDIRGTLTSVIQQDYPNIEYIVVDGKSSDNTLEIITEYDSSIDKFISESDRGIYDAINKGLKLATGDIVGLIHAGDRLYAKNTIGKIAQHFDENDIDASYGHSLIVNSKDQPIRVNKSPEYRKSLFKRGWMPSHQSIYLKRSLLKRLGFYRIDLGGSGDYEFVLRYFYCNDIKVKRLDDFIIRFAMGGTSTSNYRRLLQVQRVHIKCWKLNGISPPFYLIPLKLARKIPQFSKALLARFNGKGNTTNEKS